MDYKINDLVVKGNDAKHLLDNPILKEAFDQVAEHLEERMLSIKSVDVRDCQDIVRTTQILTALERAIYSFIENGKFAQAELNAISKEKVSVFNRGF